MHVAIIGPDLDARGGIASVARAWLEAPTLADVKMDYVGTMRDGRGPRKALGMARRQAAFVGRLARGWRPDLFHIHLSYFTSFYRKMAYFEQAKATGAAVIVHIHAPDLDEFNDARRVHGAAMRHVFSRADRTVVLSKDMAKTVRRITGDDAAIEILYNPVALDGPAPIRPPTDHPTALFLGEIGQRKGTWDLVEAIPAVLEQVPHARFRIGGNGDVDRLNARVAELGLQHAVTVLGWVTGADKQRELIDADLLVLPSYQEGLPMSILEAMGVGLPVVSTPIAGIPEAVIDGRTGLLVPPGNTQELAAALSRLLSTPDLRADMGAAARARAQDVFALDVVTAQLRDLWAAVLATR
jgi:glycosyltransferase involved in cell wall biosynthesis